MNNESTMKPASIVLLVLVGVLVIAGFVALPFGCKSYNRYQKRMDAKNKVKVTAIQIQNMKQKSLVTKQQIQLTKQLAEIRHQQSIGIRKAQDEIAKTLTPLYVQFEMTEALKEIARSGQNNSVVYIPAGASGVPLVATTNPDQVTAPDK